MKKSLLSSALLLSLAQIMSLNAQAQQEQQQQAVQEAPKWTTSGSINYLRDGLLGSNQVSNGTAVGMDGRYSFAPIEFRYSERAIQADLAAHMQLGAMNALAAPNDAQVYGSADVTGIVDLGFRAGQGKVVLLGGIDIYNGNAIFHENAKFKAGVGIEGEKSSASLTFSPASHAKDILQNHDLSEKVSAEFRASTKIGAGITMKATAGVALLKTYTQNYSDFDYQEVLYNKETGFEKTVSYPTPDSKWTIPNTPSHHSSVVEIVTVQNAGTQDIIIRNNKYLTSEGINLRPGQVMRFALMFSKKVGSVMLEAGANLNRLNASETRVDLDGVHEYRASNTSIGGQIGIRFHGSSLFSK